MAVLDILTHPDARLREPSAPVTRFDPELAQFVRDLEQTMRHGPAAVGIAAPQVGRRVRIVLVDASGRKGVQSHGCLALINPEITSWEGLAVGREGCLSVPEYTGNVVRAERIRLTACDVEGVAAEYHFEGFEARVVQHEVDHLDGLLFLDRLVSRRNDLFRRRRRAGR